MNERRTKIDIGNRQRKSAAAVITAGFTKTR